MNKVAIVGLGFFSMVMLIALCVVLGSIGTYNSATGLKVSIEAKIKDNKNEFDNMKKKISQVAQVSSAQMEALADIFNTYARERSGNSIDDNLIMKWVQESVPNVDISTYKNLQNIIVSSRDAWTMRQKELIDLQREYNTMLKKFPSNIILSMFGFKEIDIPVIISTETQKVFETQKDDDVSVFRDNKVEK